MDTGHWIFNEEFDINDWFGFIYRIIEIDTGREYIGKKQFHQHLKKAVKGRKNKKSVKKESNWKTYTSSSEALNQAILKKGKDNYIFLIESLHKSKGSLAYEEVRKQVNEDVLRSKLSDQITPRFFNRNINGVKFIPPDEVSDETRMKLSNTLRERYRTSPHWKSLLTEEELKEHNEKFYIGENNFLYRLLTPEEREAYIKEHCVGENNPMYGISPPQKNKTFEDYYGEEKAIQIKQILRETCPRRGKDHGMYGKTHSEETKEKWRTDSRRIHRGEENGMFGKPCFYKMTDKEIDMWKQNISKSCKGKSKPDGFGEKLSKASKGHKKVTATCNYCNKTGGRGNMLRYHFENCKFKPNN